MNIKPTRMELLKTKKKIKLAVRGHKLLKEKRDALMMQFFSILKDIKALRHDIMHSLSQASKALYNAESIEGQANIDRFLNSRLSSVEIEFETKNIMGLKVPTVKDIKQDNHWHGFLEHSIELDHAIIRYRELLPRFMELAEKQLALKRIGDEIKSTKRKVNSLEYLILPRLEKAKSLISFRLSELERENFARLKLIKTKIAKNEQI